MDKQTRQTWEKEQRRNRLVDESQKIFFLKGYDASTIDDIASAAGYTKRSIYLYFKDKEEIFLAVVRRGLELLYSLLRQALEDKNKTQPQVFKLARAYYNFSLEHAEFFDLIMIYESRIHVYYNGPSLEDPNSSRAQCMRFSNLQGDLVKQAIAKDVAAGFIRTKLTPEQLMLLLWGQIFGVMQIILIRKKMFQNAYGISHEELFEELLSMASKMFVR